MIVFLLLSFGKGKPIATRLTVMIPQIFFIALAFIFNRAIAAHLMFLLCYYILLKINYPFDFKGFGYQHNFMSSVCIKLMAQDL